MAQPNLLVDHPSIYSLICTFNSISKYIGFAVTRFDDTVSSKFSREIIFLWSLLFTLFCTVIAELVFIKFLDMGLEVRQVVVLCVAQIVNVSPFVCLAYFRLCDFAIWKIVLKVKRLEENLIVCNIYLEIGRIGLVGLFFWFFQFFIILSLMWYAVWPGAIYYPLDVICIFYFEACIIVPYLQFLVWIWFLSFVSYCARLRIIEINNLECVTKTDSFTFKNSPLLYTTFSNGYEFDKMNQITRVIVVLKQVLHIARELSAAYGITILIYIFGYLSKIILQFYDLLDAQRSPVLLDIVIIIIRLVFILPVFICCENLRFNIRKAIELIQEIATFRHPSCLGCIFQRLTLRLQHQNTSTQICGFLNIDYGSFLTIMTTSLAFLILQLQFRS